MSLPTIGNGNWIKAKVQITPSVSVSGFTGKIDLSLLPLANKTHLFDDVDTTDGTKGRVSLGERSNEIASDWVNFDNILLTGQIYFNLGTIPITGDVFVYIYSPNTRNDSYLRTDIYGRDNAYPSFKGFWTDGFECRNKEGFDGVGSGGVTIGGSDGLFGSATDFDGIDDSVIVTGDGTFRGDSMSFGCTVNTDSTNNGIGIWHSQTEETDLIFGIRGVNLYFVTNGLGTITLNIGDYTAGSNTRIVGVYDGVTASVYKNGVLVDSVSSADVIATSTLNSISFGSKVDEVSNLLNGSAQEFFVADVLSSDYITLNDNQTLSNDTFWGEFENSNEIVLTPADGTIYLLAMGQSNALGRDTTNTKTINTDVEIANTTSGVFEVWDLDADPSQYEIPDPNIGSTGAVISADCPAWYFANHIATTYNVKVKVLLVAWGGVQIAPFMSSTGEMWTEFESQMTTFDSSVPRIDIAVWLQGESDAGDTNYDTYLKDVIADYRSHAKIPDNLPWINGQVLDLTVNDSVNADLVKVADEDANVYTTLSTGLTEIGDELHFDSASLVAIGETLWAVPLVSAATVINENSQQFYKIDGVTYDKDGNILPSCQVSLFKHYGDGVYEYVSTQLSDDTTGVYDFSLITDNEDYYMVIANKTGVFDCTDNNITPVEV